MNELPVHGEHDHRDQDDCQDHEDDDEEVEVHARGLTCQHILHVAAVLQVLFIGIVEMHNINPGANVQ